MKIDGKGLVINRVNMGVKYLTTDGETEIYYKDESGNEVSNKVTSLKEASSSKDEHPQSYGVFAWSGNKPVGFVPFHAITFIGFEVENED